MTYLFTYFFLYIIITVKEEEDKQNLIRVTQAS